MRERRIYTSRMPGKTEDSARILVAEDDPYVRRLIARVLRRMGFKVTAVASGEELWHAWTRLQSRIILSDIHMPGAMNGIDACLAIRRADPGVRLFLISGYPEAAKQAALKGLDVVLLKPFDIYDLERWATGI